MTAVPFSEVPVGATFLADMVDDGASMCTKVSETDIRLPRNIIIPCAEFVECVVVPTAWIRVDERLPEEGGRWVLVYADGAMGCLAWTNKGWEDWTQQGVPNINIHSITHWMPLPDRPPSTE